MNCMKNSQNCEMISCNYLLNFFYSLAETDLTFFSCNCEFISHNSEFVLISHNFEIKSCNYFFSLVDISFHTFFCRL